MNEEEDQRFEKCCDMNDIEAFASSCLYLIQRYG